jgi:hypothetical protein
VAASGADHSDILCNSFACDQCCLCCQFTQSSQSSLSPPRRLSLEPLACCHAGFDRVVLSVGAPGASEKEVRTLPNLSRPRIIDTAPPPSLLNWHPSLSLLPAPFATSSTFVSTVTVPATAHTGSRTSYIAGRLGTEIRRLADQNNDTQWTESPHPRPPGLLYT